MWCETWLQQQRGMRAGATHGIGFWVPTCLYLPVHGACGQLHAFCLMAGSGLLDVLCSLQPRPATGMPAVPSQLTALQAPILKKLFKKNKAVPEPPAEPDPESAGGAAYVPPERPAPGRPESATANPLLKTMSDVWQLAGFQRPNRNKTKAVPEPPAEAAPPEDAPYVPPERPAPGRPESATANPLLKTMSDVWQLAGFQRPNRKVAVRP